MAKLKLSSFLSGVSGRAGNAVYRYTKNGTELSDRPFVNNPNTPAQSLARSAFSKATKAWKTLTAAQAAAWNAYAASITETEAVTGVKTKRSGFNWYVALSSRFYQVNNMAGTAPATPPASAFTGDALTFTLGAQSGGIKVTASGANSAGTVTALKFQKLTSANSKPQKAKYTTKAYFAFPSGSPATTVPLAPGVYSVAIQYVSTATGQETAIQVLGTVSGVTFAVAAPDAGAKKKAA